MSDNSQWGNVVSWGLIILGWVIVNRQNNNRETRKEIRAGLLDLYKLLDEIEDDAFIYHTEIGDPVVARKIKRSISQIAPRIKLALRKRVECKYGFPLYAFRQSITLSNFETNLFAAKLPNDQFFTEIMDAKHALILRLDSAFNETFS
jgi:hypothetical protein